MDGLDWNLGRLPSTVGLTVEYFRRRGILLDCRGPLVIHANSHWGFKIMVLTESHEIHKGFCGNTIPYGVQVDEEAWIGSGSILAGCHIGKGAIVAAGTVVRGQDVDPHIIVAGNPARTIARWGGSAWNYLNPSDSGFVRSLK